jgi:hypothetical protein
VSADRLPILRIWSDPYWQTVWKEGNQFITQVDLDLVQSSNDFSSDISIDKFFRKLKMFSKDIKFSVTSDETDERDSSIWDIVDFGQFELWRRQGR